MRTPYRKRRVQRPPRTSRFKPAGIPSRKLKRLSLSVGEYEAIRLADHLGLEHREAAQRMDISRPTFTRLIEKARHKVARALVDGFELVIEGGDFDYVERLYRCRNCGEIREFSPDEQAGECASCGGRDTEDLAELFPPNELQNRRVCAQEESS